MNFAPASNLLEWALFYASLGWKIHPLHTPTANGCSCSRGANCGLKDRGKHPRLTGWKDHATSDEATIRGWWHKWPRANIGLWTGPESGVIFLDQDGEEGALYIAEKGGVPPCPTSATGHGHHYVFEHPGFAVSNLVKPVPGLDVRGDNGNVVLPPSLHYTGRYYEWEQEPTLPLPEVPGWFLALLQPPQTPTQGDLLSQESPGCVDCGAALDKPGFTRCAACFAADRQKRWVDKALKGELDTLKGAKEGERNATLFKVATRLYELVGKGLLNEGEVDAALARAAVANGMIGSDGLEAFHATLESAKARGHAAGDEANVPDFRAAPDPIATAGDAPAKGERMEAHHPPPVDADLLHYRAEDGGILDAWIDLYRDGWCWATGWDIWLLWSGSHWQKDQTLLLPREVHDLMNVMNQRAGARMQEIEQEIARANNGQLAGLEEEYKRMKSYKSATKRSQSRIVSVEKMARGHCARPTTQMDGGNVLNLQNGTLNLDTYTLRAHSPHDLQTYVLPYAYDAGATCPRWRAFLREVLVNEDYQPDEQLITLYQELFGYSLTTDTKLEKMVWQAGEGGNGKSVATRVLAGLLGPLAMPVNFQTLGASGNYDLADMPGKRVVFSTEAERGGAFAEDLIRKLASGEAIRTRPIYGSAFDLLPCCKIWWSMNDLPRVGDTSNATWRRLVLIPFHRTFSEEEKDPLLSEKLLEELPGVLNWALEGLRRVRKQRGFTNARSVAEAVEELRQESNPVALYLGERTQPLPEPETPARELYNDYQGWCKDTGRQALNNVNFGREVKRLRVGARRTKHGMFYAAELLPRDTKTTGVSEIVF